MDIRQDVGKYVILEISPSEINLLKDLLKCEVVLQIHDVISNTELENAFKTHQVTMVFDYYRELDIQLLEFAISMGATMAELKKNNPRSSVKNIIVLQKGVCRFYSTLCTLTVRAGLPPTIQEQWDALGASLLQRIEVALLQNHSLDDVKAKMGIAQKAEDSTAKEDGLPVNIFGKGLA